MLPSIVVMSSSGSGEQVFGGWETEGEVDGFFLNSSETMDCNISLKKKAMRIYISIDSQMDEVPNG